jgi:F-box protein 21
LDEYSQEIRLESTEFDSKTTRQKCLLILNYLRAHDLTGLQTEQDYRNLRNNFIGIAVNSEPHSSLPLISTAIFCSVAQRLGVDAAACSFPFHVVAMVRPPTGLTLDGTAVQKAAAPMYLDPFSSSAEIALSDLVRRLEQIRVSSALYGDYLSASSVEEIVLRTGRNIINSVQDLHQRNLTRQTLANANDWAPISSFPDLESAFYSALWASLLLGIPPDGDGPGFSMRRREFLPHIIEQFESNFPTDVSLIEAYILPLFRSTGEYAQLRESIRVTRSVDAMPKSVKRRSKEVSQRVRYRIGQVFTHKRYHYQAVITGWDMECGADELWMHRMRIHELSRGKQQSFYHVLSVRSLHLHDCADRCRVEDKSVRYVAEENIISMSSEPSQGLMRLAGRHLKRWDSASGCFVSNIRDEYPDD